MIGVRRKAFKAAAVGTALLGLVLRMLSGGWLFIPGSLIYLAIGMAHTLFHFRALRSIEQGAIQPLAILSNCLLLLAFLLQIDYGDGGSGKGILGYGECGWITTETLTTGPGYEPCIYLDSGYGALLDILLFVPVALTWARLRRAGRASSSV